MQLEEIEKRSELKMQMLSHNFDEDPAEEGGKERNPELFEGMIMKQEDKEEEL